MNYRRGFLRVYAVLTVTWIVVSSLVLHWKQPQKFFDRDAAHKAGVSDVDILQYLRSTRKVDAEQEKAIEELMRQHALGELNERQRTKLESLLERLSGEPKGQSAFQSGSIQRLLRFSAWAFLPPVAGYVLFFAVAPWIYRGFQTTDGVDKTMALCLFLV